MHGRVKKESAHWKWNDSHGGKMEMNMIKKATVATTAVAFSTFLCAIYAHRTHTHTEACMISNYFMHLQAPCNGKDECQCSVANETFCNFFICFTWTRKINSYEIPFYFSVSLSSCSHDTINYTKNEIVIEVRTGATERQPVSQPKRT